MADEMDWEGKLAPYARARDVGIDPEEVDFEKASEAFRADMSTIYVDPDANARFHEYAFPDFDAEVSERDDVEEAEASEDPAAGGSPPSEPPGGDGVHFSDFMTDRDRGHVAVEEYLDAVSAWRSGADVANRADVIEELQSRRLDAIKTISDTGFLGDPRLDEVEDYVRADTSFLDRPDAAEEDYASFVRRQTHLREQVFGNEIIVDADGYAEATQKFQNFISGEKNISLQYDYLRVRRDAALEHFDDPRFIAQIGLHEADLGDELLIDFDRSDLIGEDGRGTARSSALAETFSEAVGHGLTSGSSADRVHAFMVMRAAGQSIRHDQMAIMEFARTNRDDRVIFEAGLASMDNVIFSDDVGKSWYDGLSKDDRKYLKENNDPISFFQMARVEFEEALVAGNGARAAESFAVLERGAELIHGRDSLRRKLRDAGSIEDVQALHVLSEKSKDARQDEVASLVETSVLTKMEQSGKLSTESDRSGSAVQVDEESGEEVYKLDLKANAATAKVSVIDGAHVLVSNTAEDSEAGQGIVMRLDGITVPPSGTQTKSGQLDAGQMAKEHLQVVLNQHAAAGLGMAISKNEKQEDVLNITLSSGENLSNRMIVDGYAMPTVDSDGKIRREHLANQAEAQNRGIWREGFPDMDESWRSERSGPTLSAWDKKERVCRIVGEAVAGSKDDAYRRLMRKDTKIFGLAVEQWSSDHRIDEEVMKIAKTNPGRLQDIYANNMEILQDLRKRKDKLTDDEKLAHDRLSLGRRAMAKSLVATGHMTEEQATKDGHPLMSRKSRRLNMERLRPIGEATMKTIEGSVELGKETGRRSKQILGNMIDVAME